MGCSIEQARAAAAEADTAAQMARVFEVRILGALLVPGLNQEGTASWCIWSRHPHLLTGQTIWTLGSIHNGCLLPTHPDLNVAAGRWRGDQ